jgi:predicted thioredoxin/glutaredoxin
LAKVRGELDGECRIEVREVNVFERPDVALRHGVWATPALIIDGQLAAVGPVRESDVREKLAAAQAMALARGESPPA